MTSGKCAKWLIFLGLAATLLVLSGASGLAQSDSPGRDTFKPPKSLKAAYVPGEVLVKFKNSPATFRGKPSREHFPSIHGAAAAQFAAALPDKARASLEQVQGQVIQAHPNIGVLRVKLPAHISVSQALDHLHRSGMVEYAEPNGVIIPQASIPNDPSFGSQWGLTEIKAPEAWDITTGSHNTIVAVIDTGVDYNHEDFYLAPGDLSTSNIWVNSAEIPGNNSDDDDNHFVDDFFGINTTVTPSTGDPIDSHGHGTAMAGIIGAVGNNFIVDPLGVKKFIGITGINWQTKIMSLKCMTSTGGIVSNAITCINYALSQRAKVSPPPPMVLTLGWTQATNTYDNALHDALRIAQDSGVLVVASAGNNDEDNDILPNYPSSYNHDVKDFGVQGSLINPDNITLDNVIAVGGSDQFDKKETNSSYGMATVDLFAPNKNIWSTMIGNKYGNVGTGTSYAAAHVAGACALLWSRYPDKDWKQIKAMIMNGAEDGAAQDFHAISVTEGRLNLFNSLNPAIENDPAVFSIFEVPPTVMADPPIVPGRADTNDILVITGVNFGTSGSLSFLGMTFPGANILRWKDEQIMATVPAGLPKGVGRLQVTNAAGRTSRGACFSNIARERQVGSLIMARGLAASAQVNRNVYIIGGRTYWGTVPHVERYSLDTNHTVVDSAWAMPTPVSNAGAASIGAKIYVAGGLWEDPVTGNTSLVPNLQIFDTDTRTWENGPPLPKPLMQCAVTRVGAKLYVFGGLASTTLNSAAVNNAYVYDTVTKVWTGLAVLPYAVAYAAAAPTGAGKIWLMGGFTSSAATTQQRYVQEYDPALNQWTQQLHLVRPRGGAAGLNFGGQVYCLHGSKPYAQNLAVYDEYADGEWYNFDSAWNYWMPSIMNYLGIFVAPPSVLARKGLFTPLTGKYLDQIFVLGGVTGTEIDYKYSFSNKVWAFPAPGGGSEIGTDGIGKGFGWVPLLLMDD